MNDITLIFLLVIIIGYLSYIDDNSQENFSTNSNSYKLTCSINSKTHYLAINNLGELPQIVVTPNLDALLGSNSITLANSIMNNNPLTYDFIIPKKENIAPLYLDTNNNIPLIFNNKLILDTKSSKPKQLIMLNPQITGDKDSYAYESVANNIVAGQFTVDGNIIINKPIKTGKLFFNFDNISKPEFSNFYNDDNKYKYSFLGDDVINMTYLNNMIFYHKTKKIIYCITSIGNNRFPANSISFLCVRDKPTYFSEKNNSNSGNIQIFSNKTNSVDTYEIYWSIDTSKAKQFNIENNKK
jgi:hypothetical protein